MTLTGIAAELYGLPPETFTGVRNARAREVAAAGDRSLADEIRRLAKPTAAAWLANLLVRTSPTAVEELIGLGPGLRRAQGRGDREEMRRIVDRRRAVIGELVATASAAARDAGHPVGSPVLRQLEETLEAAVADEGSAAALRGGRLSEPLRFVGFGPSSTPDPGAAGTAGTKTAKDKSARRHKDTEPSQAAAREAREAREARRVLQAAVAAAEAHRDAAGERYRRAVAELGAAEDDRAAAGAALREARRALARATRRAGT